MKDLQKFIGKCVEIKDGNKTYFGMIEKVFEGCTEFGELGYVTTIHETDGPTYRCACVKVEDVRLLACYESEWNEALRNAREYYDYDVQSLSYHIANCHKYKLTTNKETGKRETLKGDALEQYKAYCGEMLAESIAWQARLNA